jgi:transcriptional regulator NrdR family protein
VADARVPVREVVRRDGTRERFDPARLSASIHRAAVAVGQGELLLAEELAALVALVLEEEFGAAAPSTRAVRETAERVLMETGHHDVARSYILFHAREPARPSAAASPRAARGEADGEVAIVRVASLGRECVEPFDPERLATSLMLEESLNNGDASEIAAAVDRSLAALGEPVVPASTVRQLVARELVERDRGDVLVRSAGVGVPAREVEALAFARAVGERPDTRPAALLGAEMLRRFSLAKLLEPAVARAHLEGDLHVDGLAAPGQARSATIDFSDVRRTQMPATLAALVRLVHALEPALHGTLALHHVERAVVPALDGAAAADSAATALLLALADAAVVRHGPGATAPRRVLGLGVDLSESLATALFRRGGEPNAMRARLRLFVTKLLDQAVVFGAQLRLPLLRLLVDPGEEERDLAAVAASLQPALALGLAEVDHAPHDAGAAAAVRVVGGRVALNVARLGLRAGRRRESELLASLREAVDGAVSAGADLLRRLLQRDELGDGFLRRLRDCARELGRDLPLDLPGHHAYHVTIVPVGVDAAVRAVTERDPSESESGARLRDDLLAQVAAALPQSSAGGLSGARFEAKEESFPEAELRFGALDWHRFPRGRDVLGLAHDGAAFRYAFDPVPRAMAMAAAVSGSPLSSIRSSRPLEGSDVS